jgi:hypothetical protein
MPKKYGESVQKQEWFIEGAWDAAAGWTESDFRTLALRQGVEIAEAYKAGYAAGKATKRTCS